MEALGNLKKKLKEKDWGQTVFMFSSKNIKKETFICPSTVTIPDFAFFCKCRNLIYILVGNFARVFRVYSTMALLELNVLWC